MPASTPALPASKRVRDLVSQPMGFTAKEWARIGPVARRLSFFSAAVEDAHLLQGLREMVQAGIDEGLPEASAVARMREWLRETRNAATGQPYLGDRSAWTEEERVAYENSVKHIDSLARLKLIFRTQAEMGAGYAQWREGYTRLGLAAYPGWRFYRRPGARTFRADHVEHEGQVRLKTDLPYWLARNRVEIGGFANPWPPFGYNSWMWIAPVSRAECEKLGLLKPGEKVAPLTDEESDTWGVPRLLQKTLGERGGKTMSPQDRQHVIDTCKKHGFDVWYNEQTGKFEFGKAPAVPAPTPQPALATFTPAATRDEAIAFTRTMAKNVKFHPNVAREQINDFNAAVSKLQAEYNMPGLSELGSYIANDGEGAKASHVRIMINADLSTGGIHGFARWRSYLNPDSDGFTRHNVGASPQGISMEDVITHEGGHTLSIQAMVSEWRTGKYRNGAKDILCHTPTYKAIQKVRLKAIKNGDIKKISKYAKKNPHEFFAESFVAWKRGETLPQYIVDLLELITAPYKK